MTSLAVSLTVALALGAGEEGRPAARGGRTEWAAKNAERAKVGLLPRKPPPKARAIYRNGRRIVATSAPAPTFLGEPGLPAEPVAYAPRTHGGRTFGLAASGVITDVTLSIRLDR